MTAMEKKNIKGITPFRMQQIMKTASDAASLIISSKHLYDPSYRECEIVLELIQEAIRKGKNEYREGARDVFEQDDVEETDKIEF